MIEIERAGSAWRTSSHSDSTANCVEIAFTGRLITARDSKHRTGPTLTWSKTAWAAFVEALCGETP